MDVQDSEKRKCDLEQLNSLGKKQQRSLLRSIMTTVAIMQPTFLPWLGYFALMNEVDIFVLLDDVQFSRQSFQQRNRIKTAQGPLVLTVPCRGRKNLIRDVEIAVPPKFLCKKMIASISQSYSKAPYEFEFMPALKHVFEQNHAKLCELNCSLIKEIANFLKIKAKIIIASDLNLRVMERTCRTLRICEVLNADQYLSVPGSFSYLKNSDPFETSSIKLRFFSFKHPEYPQLHGTFEAYLSVIDAIFNVGSSETHKLMKLGVHRSLNISEMSSSSC